MDKIIKLPDYFESTGEPTVSEIGSYELQQVKCASSLLHNLKDVRPEKGKTKVVVIAMTDGGHYGPNNNGDWFSEPDLMKYHPTFVSMAKVFRHHINKPDSPSYGAVESSHYNETMRRVELLIALENEKAPDLVDQIHRGIPISVSMGCRLPFEVCSICGHKSPTIRHRCEHLRFMNKTVMDDGRRVFAYNPGPLKFFDISVVTKPADKSAWMLKKVAHETPYELTDYDSAEEGDRILTINSKVAALDKVGDIIKKIKCEAIHAKNKTTVKDFLSKGMPDRTKLSEEELDIIASYPAGTIESLVDNHEVAFSYPEMVYMKLAQLGSQADLDELTEFLGDIGDTVDMLREDPEKYSSIITKMATDNRLESLDMDDFLESIIEKRSLSNDHLMKRAAQDPLTTIYDTSDYKGFSRKNNGVGHRRGSLDVHRFNDGLGRPYIVNRSQIKKTKAINSADRRFESTAALTAGAGIGGYGYKKYKKIKKGHMPMAIGAGLMAFGVKRLLDKDEKVNAGGLLIPKNTNTSFAKTSQSNIISETENNLYKLCYWLHT